ncbi:unnamed protein product, partial [Choristocarpus tenellus]
LRLAEGGRGAAEGPGFREACRLFRDEMAALGHAPSAINAVVENVMGEVPRLVKSASGLGGVVGKGSQTGLFEGSQVQSRDGEGEAVLPDATMAEKEKVVTVDNVGTTVGGLGVDCASIATEAEIEDAEEGVVTRAMLLLPFCRMHDVGGDGGVDALNSLNSLNSEIEAPAALSVQVSGLTFSHHRLTYDHRVSATADGIAILDEDGIRILEAGCVANPSEGGVVDSQRGAATSSGGGGRGGKG